MTERMLKPPTRFSHLLLLALVLAIGGLLTGAIGQRPTLVAGLTTLSLFLGGFWAFSRDAWVYTAVGTVLVGLGALGLLVTAVWGLLGSLAAPSMGSAVLSLGVTLAVLGALVGVVGDLVPTRVTNQDGPAIVALVYTGGLAVGIVAIVSAVQLGAARVFGSTATSIIDTNLELLLRVVTSNPVARAGSFALLGGAVLWYAAKLWKLPLGRRLSRGLALRWTLLRADDGVSERTGKTDGTGISTEVRSGANEAGSAPQTVTQAFGFGHRVAAAPRWIGAAAFYLGLGALVIGLAPEMQRTISEHPAARAIGSVLGESAATQRSLIEVLLVLGGLRIVHIVAWRGLNVDWAASGRRLGHGMGAAITVLGAGVSGGSIVGFLLQTPGLQFVPMGGSAPVVVATEAGLKFGGSGLAGVGLERRPDVFETWFGGVVELFSPAVVGVTFLAVLVSLSMFVLVLATIAAAGAGVTRPGAGIGLLFVASAGVAVIGASTMLAFGTGAAALLAWELYTHGGSLNRQLDPRASTITAELVHLGASVVLIGLAVVVALAGLWGVRLVPTPETQWQVMGALALSVTALVLGLLYLGLWGDRTGTTGPG